MKNLLIVIIGALIAFFILSKTSPKEQVPIVEDGGIVVPAETKITSLKGVEIFLSEPQIGGGISSPLVVKGRAPGNWFFEASAPVVLTNWDGLIIAEGYMTAEGDWMTTDYVPFMGTIDFVKPDYGERGTIIFQKDNPSGESQFDDAAEINVIFK